MFVLYYIFSFNTTTILSISITCVNSMDASYIPIAEARGFTTHWKKALLFTPFSATRFAGYYQRTTKKPAVNDRLVKCNTLKGHLKSYDICFYIIPANTDAPITVSNPATAMARLLIAPSTGPSSMALAVPIAWADVPSPRPLAIGSSIFAIL